MAIDEERAEAGLRARLERQASPKEALLQNTNLDDDQVKVFVRLMQEAAQAGITSVNLALNSFTWRGVKPLQDLLFKLPSQIVKLDLSSNNLCNDGNIVIAKALETNNSIQSLIVSNTELDNEAAVALGHALKMNRALRRLDVEHNPFLYWDHSPRGRFGLIDGYVTKEDFKLFVGEMAKRLDFARMVIEVEPKGKALAETVLMYTIDQHNAIIHNLLQVWRECKSFGLPLFKLKKEEYKLLDKYVYQLKKNNQKESKKLEGQARSIIAKVRSSAARYAVNRSRRIKVLVVGDKKSGKSTLVNSLIAKRSSLMSKNAPAAVVTMKELVLQGIVCNVYDFGGQKAYRAFPTFFISQRCLIMIAINMLTYKERRDYYMKKVNYWIEALKCHIPKAKIVLVGTNADTVPGAAERKKITDHIENQYRDHEIRVRKKYKFNLDKLNSPAQSKKDEERQIDWLAGYAPRNDQFTRFLDATRWTIHKLDDPSVPRTKETLTAPMNSAAEPPKAPEVILKQLENSRPHVQFSGRVLWTSSTGEGLHNLHYELLNLFKDNPDDFCLKLPKSYVLLANKLEELGCLRQTRILPIETIPPIQFSEGDGLNEGESLCSLFVDRKGKNRLFRDVKELKKALKDLAKVGQVVWFNRSESLNNWVILSPHWLTTMINSLIRHDMFSHTEEDVLESITNDFLTEDDREGHVRLEKQKERFEESGVIAKELLFCFDNWKEATRLQRELMILVLNQMDVLCPCPHEFKEGPGTELDALSEEFFVPFYRKSAVGKSNSLKHDIVRLPDIPVQLWKLFPKIESVESGGKTYRSQHLNYTNEMLNGKHVQYQFLFVNGFPEGVFLRLLVRIQPYVSIDYATTTEGGAVVHDPNGCEFIIEEHRKYQGWNSKTIPGGALLLTGIRKDGDEASFWNTIVLLTAEIGALLDTYRGLLTGVFVAFYELTDLVSNTVIIAQRRKMEEMQRELLSQGYLSSREIFLDLGSDLSIPLTRILPETCSAVGMDYLQDPVTLKRRSYFGKVQAVLDNIESQLADDGSEFWKGRLKIMHMEIMQILESLLLNFTVSKGGSETCWVQEYCETLLQHDPMLQDLVAKIKSFYRDEQLYMGPKPVFRKTFIRQRVVVCRELFVILANNIADLAQFPGGSVV